jgi:hypothetical protein
MQCPRFCRVATYSARPCRHIAEAPIELAGGQSVDENRQLGVFPTAMRPGPQGRIGTYLSSVYPGATLSPK